MAKRHFSIMQWVQMRQSVRCDFLWDIRSPGRLLCFDTVSQSHVEIRHNQTVDCSGWVVSTSTDD